MLATTDGLVLVVHDSARAGCGRVPQVACKARNGGKDDDDTEFAALFACSNASINDRATDRIEDGTLLVARGSDW